MAASVAPLTPGRRRVAAGPTAVAAAGAVMSFDEKMGDGQKKNHEYSSLTWAGFVSVRRAFADALPSAVGLSDGIISGMLCCRRQRGTKHAGVNKKYISGESDSTAGVKLCKTGQAKVVRGVLATPGG